MDKCRDIDAPVCLCFNKQTACCVSCLLCPTLLPSAMVLADQNCGQYSAVTIDGTELADNSRRPRQAELCWLCCKQWGFRRCFTAAASTAPAHAPKLDFIKR